MNRSQIVTTTALLLAAWAFSSTASAQYSKPKAEPGKNQVVPKAPAKPNTLSVRIMTANVENWSHVFEPRAVLATTRPGLPDDVVDVLKNARAAADEENWEVARNILDVQPDIWVLQEGCDVKDLNYWNTQFLDGYFETVHVFTTNTGRGQNTAILVKPGFKVLEFKEDYYKEPDTNDVNPSDKLFARGPGFALIQAPNGTKFWVGTNHAKSKSGNSVEVTKWRNAEAVRTHQIIEDLAKSGPAQVFFMGDMNDELGYQEFEQQAGGSAIESIAGKGADALTIVTKPLADSGAISYHGQRGKRHQSFIDHVFATSEAAKWVQNVAVFTGDLADVVSDHYPVYFDVAVPQ